MSTNVGFASDAVRGPRHAAPGAASPSGFASDAPAPTPAPSTPEQVKASGFAETNTPRAMPHRPGPQAINRAVEVTFKPRPDYTEEARALRIEGEVTLEVEFTADGQARVLRVARSLGHGLDEMARIAVEQIRFNPALRNGVPTSSRSHVNIVFRLT